MNRIITFVLTALTLAAAHYAWLGHMRELALALLTVGFIISFTGRSTPR